MKQLVACAYLAAWGCSSAGVYLPPPDAMAPLPMLEAAAPPPDLTQAMAEKEWYPVDAQTVAALAGDRNFDVSAAWLATRTAESQAELAKSAIWPTLRPALRFFSLDGRTQGTAGEFLEVQKQNLELGLGVTLTLDLVESRTQALSAGQRARASAEHSGAVRRVAILASQELYDELLFTQLDLAIARELLEGARSVAELERIRESQGRGLRADRLRAEALEAEAEGDVLRADASFRESSIRLAEHLRLSPTVTLYAPDPTVEPLQLFPGQLDVLALIDEALTARPEVAAALFEVEAAEQELSGARLAPWMPKLFVSFEESGFGPNFGNLNDQEDLALGLQWDLSPARFRRTDLAHLRLRTEQLSLARTRETIGAGVVRYCEIARISGSAIDSGRRRVEASQEGMSVVRERHAAGSALIVEVLEAQRQLALARRHLVRTTLEHNRAQRRLAFAVGR